MSRFDEAPEWVGAYQDAFRDARSMLLGIRKRPARATACLKMLIGCSASLSSRAAAAIAAPSAKQAIELAQIAGAATAARATIEQGAVELRGDKGRAPETATMLAQRSAPWAGTMAVALMDASDGQMDRLLGEGAVARLRACLQPGAGGETARLGLNQAGGQISQAASFLAELNASAVGRPESVHQARAEQLSQEISTTRAVSESAVSVHAFAIHYLTGIHGPGDAALRATLVRFIASHPPYDRAAVQASRVAALLSDALGPRAKLALLDHMLILLGPRQGDRSIPTAIARDTALVLLLLEEDANASNRLATPPTSDTVSAPTASPPSPPNDREPAPTRDAEPTTNDVIAEILREAEQAIADTGAERDRQYQEAVAAARLKDALAIVGAAAADDDYEQAWTMLSDLAHRFPEAQPHELILTAPNVLGNVPLDSDASFDGPGAGSFTVLSPTPSVAAAAIDRVASRLMNVDDHGTEHPDSPHGRLGREDGGYTPNHIHPVLWSDYGVQLTLDTKGVMPAPMARTMLTIITDALIADHTAAVITGHIPTLTPHMTRQAREA